MTTFISCSHLLEAMLPFVVASSEIHAKWLNTLSYLENCGARKIAACEHPTLVREEMLKHASEEFRHAHYLKRQIERISPDPFPDYSLSNILGGWSSLRYLDILDVKTSRYLCEKGLTRDRIKETAYLLVTYAIERRAEELYPLYEQILRKSHSKVIVRSIILEEKEHLQEMEYGIHKIPCGPIFANYVCSLEGQLCLRWFNAVLNDLGYKV